MAVPRQYHRRSASRFALRPWWTLVHKGLLQAGVSNVQLIYLAELSGGPKEKDIAMKIPKPHRGIAYSVADNRNGTWRWKLHPKLVPYTSTPLIAGEVPGTQNDAITAAEAAIDKFLALGTA